MKTRDTLRFASLAISVGALGTVCLTGFGPTDRASRAEAPPLPGLPLRCDVSREAASERAAQADLLAEAAIARYPFAPGDGLRALAELATASGCHTFASEPDAAARADRRASLWRQRLERDYRDHVVRYGRASTQGHLALARADIAYLLELLALHESPFTSQLRRQELQLDGAATSEPKP